jgi:hypothetical protein
VRAHTRPVDITRTTPDRASRIPRRGLGTRPSRRAQAKVVSDRELQRRRRRLEVEGVPLLARVDAGASCADGRVMGQRDGRCLRATSWASGRRGRGAPDRHGSGRGGQRRPRRVPRGPAATGLLMLGGVTLYGLSVVAFAASPAFRLSLGLMTLVGLAHASAARSPSRLSRASRISGNRSTTGIGWVVARAMSFHSDRPRQ